MALHINLTPGGCSSLAWVGLVCILALQTASGRQPQDLEILTEHTPEDCWVGADNGDEVSVHYTGTLDTGTIFDTSRQPNRGPLPFTLGEGKVIPGWEKGIKGMCVGEKRRLIIPSHLAYGKKGFPPAIPADATLTFETELVSLKKRAGEQILVRVIRFLAVPMAVIMSIFYLYDKYKKSPTKKELKGDRRGKKKKH